MNRKPLRLSDSSAGPRRAGPKCAPVSSRLLARQGSSRAHTLVRPYGLLRATPRRRSSELPRILPAF